jgi:peptide/nickel transport system permease protein
MTRRLASAWLLIWLIPSIVLFFVGTGSYDLANTLKGPSLSHPFGFDAFGRDLLLTILRASSVSIAFGFLAMVLACAFGIILGSGLALAPSLIRFYLLRTLELLLACPSILLALTWAAIRGPGWDTLLVSLSLGTLPYMTRLLYLRTQELLQEDFIHAAQGLGAGSIRIIRHHLTPHLASLCRVKAPGLFAYALIAEATLSFLGIGAPVGHDTWGSLLAQGKDYLLEAPHIAIAAGVPLVFTVLSLQILSESKSEKYWRR